MFTEVIALIFFKSVIISSLLSALVSTAATASDERGFYANYHLDAPGLPSSRIKHELSYKGDRIESHMKGAALGVAGGYEDSYFLKQEGQMSPLHYSSGYGALGIYKKYKIEPEDLGGKLDRQMMLYQLSLDALSGHCQKASPCQLDYLDHKARERSIQYHQVEHPTPTESENIRYPVSLAVTEDPDGEPLLMSFHPDHPGLIVEAELIRDGKEPYRLTLNDVVFKP